MYARAGTRNRILTLHGLNIWFWHTFVLMNDLGLDRQIINLIWTLSSFKSSRFEIFRHQKCITCIYGVSMPSLLIEFADSIAHLHKVCLTWIRICFKLTHM